MKHFFPALAAFCLSAAAFAGAADHIAVHDPYVRLMPPNAQATAAFMLIHNDGDKDAKLVKVGNPLSKISELHTHLNEGGVMKMRPVPVLDIKAKGEAVLQPGGLHIMMIDLKGQLREGEAVPITLTFDDGSSKTVEARVKRPMAGGMPEHKH